MIAILRTFTLLIAAALIAQTAVSQQVIRIDDPVTRSAIRVDRPVQTYTLCNLTPGGAYAIRPVPENPDQHRAGISLPGQRPAEVLQIVPDSSCLTLAVHARERFFGYLSAHRTDQSTSSLEKLMMGITATANNNPTELIEDVFIGGGCFDINGPESRGNNNQLGTFDNGQEAIDIQSGVILSTGSVVSAAGPNNLSSTSGGGGPGGDPDLSQLTSGAINDVVALEFEFTPTIDQISFEYVFASEEYCEYVNSSFNDVFGFFISGPGINGPFNNNAANIAVIPGSTDYVSINNVNGGSNNNFYRNNLNPNQHACNNDPPVAYDLIEYDGFTTVLTAIANVIPCETYRIKLVLADVGDGAYDSAVFLKANSFNPGNYATGEAAIVGSGPSENTAYEGCGNASITFSRTNSDVSQDFPVFYNISAASTATFGVDYQSLPNPIIIPAGQTSVTLPINIISDDIPEGVESIIVALEEPCSCTGGTLEIFIEDPPPLDVITDPVFACDGQEVTISPAVTGGTPQYSYVWSNGSTTPSITVTPPQGISFYDVAISDECAQTTSATIQVIADSPSATISGADTICQGNFDAALQVDLQGLGPWTITYQVDGIQETISGIGFSPFNLPADLPGTYQLISVESSGCFGQVDGSGQVEIAEVTIDPSSQDISCAGADDGLIALSLAGGAAPYSLNWSDGLPANAATVDSLGPGDYSVSVTDASGCFATQSFTLSEPTALTVAVDDLQNVDCTNPGAGSISVSAGGGAGGYAYSWNTGDTLATLTGVTPGDYTVVVTDATGCTAELTASIADNSESPSAVIDAPDTLDCNSPVITLSGQASTGGPNASFAWQTDDGNLTGADDEAEATVDAPGTYQLIVTNGDNGCTDTTEVVVLQDTLAPIALLAPADTLTCDLTSVTLDATGSSSGASFTLEWSTNNGNFTDGEDGLSPAVDAPGQYLLTITDNQNGCSGEATVEVAENTTAPLIALQPADVLTCDQPAVALDASASSTGPAYQYSWSTADGAITGATDTLVTTADQPGTYLLAITDTTNGCFSTDSLEVSQNTDSPLAEAGPDFELDCETSDATLDGSGSSTGAIFTYEWTTTDGNIQSGSESLNPVVTQPAGYFLTVTDTENGCTAIDSVLISENSNAPTAVAAVDATLNCVVEEVTIDASGTTNGSNIAIQWTSLENNPFDTSALLQPVVTEPGAYVLTVTDLSNSCIATATVLVEQDITAPIAEAGPDLELNCDLPVSPLNGAASSQGDNFTYDWSTEDGSLNGDLNSLAPQAESGGLYLLTVFNQENGCTAVDSVVVAEDKTAPVADLGPDQTLDCDNPAFTLTGGSSSTGPEFTYAWTADNGTDLPPTLDQTIEQAGAYALLITNTENGCTAADTLVVSSDFEIPVAAAVAANILNCDQPQTLLSSAGASQGPEFTYQWSTNDGNLAGGADSTVAVADAAGIYQLVVTNADSGCADTTSVTVSEDFNYPTASAGTGFQLDCNLPEGALDGLASSQGGDLSYAWESPDGAIAGGQNTLTPTVTTGGLYILTVENNANGCVTADSVFITEDKSAPIADAGPDGLINCAQSTYNLQALASSSGPPFELVWESDNGLTLPAGSLTPTVDQPGAYVLTVNNTENGCVSQDTVTVSANFETPEAGIAPSAILNCDNPAVTLDATASSQGQNYVYRWQQPDGSLVEGQDLTTLTTETPGLFSLEITDLTSQCTASTSVTVNTDFAAPVADAGPDQELDCTQPELILGGNSSSGPEIVYEWRAEDGEISTDSTLSSLVVDQGGWYVLQVLNTANGCTALDSVVVTASLDLPEVAVGPDRILNCGQPSLSVVPDIEAGSSTLTYLWLRDEEAWATESTLTIDQPGTYQLVVTDADNGCTSQDELVVSADFSTPQAEAGAEATLNCNQPVLTLDGAGSSQGTGITYEWTTDDGNILQDANTLNPLVDQAGLYQLVALNTASLCSDTSTVAIDENFEVPLAAIAPPAVLTCQDPVITLDGGESSTGGSITYIWTTDNGSIVAGAGSNAPAIEEAGLYLLEVTDNANGCSATAAVTVTSDQDLPQVEAGPTLTLTCDAPALALDGGNSATGPGILYEWTTDDGLILAGAATLSPEVGGAGDYQLTVINTNTGCTNSDLTTVTVDTIAPAAEAGPGFTLTCNAPEATLSGSSEGSADVAFNWSGPGIIAGADTPQPVINQAGLYEMQVTDLQNGCTESDLVSIAVDTLAPLPTIAAALPITCAAPVRTLSAEATGNGTLAYSWSTNDGQILTGANTLTPSVGAAGQYTLLVTDTDNGCTQIASVAVAVDTIAPAADAGPEIQLDCDSPSLILNGSSEAGAGFTYLWTTSEGQILNGAATLTPEVNEPGLYLLTVTNPDNGCQASDEVQISRDEDLPEVAILPPAAITCDTPAITLTALADPGFEHQWRNAAGQVIGLDNPTSITISVAGLYRLTVTDPDNGCSSSESVTVVENTTPPLAEAGPEQSLHCERTSVSLDGGASSSGAAIAYEWTTDDGFIVSGQTTTSPLINLPGMYQLTVENTENGCTAIDAVLVSETIPETMELNAIPPNCPGDRAAITVASVEGGVPPYLYSVDAGDTFGSQNAFTDLPPGLFGVVVQDANGCEIQELVTIPEPTPVNLYVKPMEVITLGDTYRIGVEVNLLAEEIASVQWTPERHLSCTDCLQPLASPLETTTYQVTVENQNGCTAETEIMLVVQEAPVYVPSAFSPYNNDGTNDRFLVYAKTDAVKQVNVLQIFNRWGEPVFEEYGFPPNDPTYGWDGLHRGQQMNPGVFVYWTEVELIDGTIVLLKGDVTLID